jgi:hypothetical protein
VNPSLRSSIQPKAAQMILGACEGGAPARCKSVRLSSCVHQIGAKNGR